MRRRSAFKVGATVAITASLLAACGGGSGTSSASDNDETDIVIGFSQRRLAGSDWWATMMDGAQDKAEELGVELIVTDAGGDTVKQNSDVQTLLTQNVDVVVMNPHDPTGVTPAVNATTGADVPLIVVNSPLSEELAAQQFCYVAEDQYDVALGLGEKLAEIAEESYGGEDVRAVVVGGYSGEENTVLRNEGVTAGFETYSGNVEWLPIRHGEWLPDRAIDPVRDIATANPDIDVVVNLSDVMLPGVKQGLNDAGILDSVIIGTYDGQMSVLEEMMNNPDGPVKVDASNEPYMQGQVAVEKAVEAAKGGAQEDVCPGGVNFIETFLATPSNAEEFYDPNRVF